MEMVESGVILVREGRGDSGVRSIGLISAWLATLTFLILPCFYPDSMNCLNYFSTDTLFSVASSRMSAVVESNSSLSYDSSERMIFHFPFPCT